MHCMKHNILSGLSPWFLVSAQVMIPGCENKSHQGLGVDLRFSLSPSAPAPINKSLKTQHRTQVEVCHLGASKSHGLSRPQSTHL